MPILHPLDLCHVVTRLAAEDGILSQGDKEPVQPSPPQQNVAEHVGKNGSIVEGESAVKAIAPAADQIRNALFKADIGAIPLGEDRIEGDHIGVKNCRIADEDVVPTAAFEDISTGAADEDVASGAAGERVGI